MRSTDGKLGLFDSVHLLVGAMIGSAIFSLSGITILQAGPASILSWILGGVILLAYGLQTAELASRYPQSGGVFAFPAIVLGKTREQGRAWGWVSAWAYLFGCVAGAAFSAIYIGIYLGVAFPRLASLQVPIAIISVLLCGYLNIVRFKITSRATTILTVFLVLALLVFSLSVFVSGKWDSTLFVPFFTQGSGGATGFLDALPLAMVAYGAIVSLSFLVGEVKNPVRNIPRAMTLAMVIVLVFYLSVLVATLGVVSSSYLADHPDLQYTPLYAAAALLPSLTFLPPLISIAAVLALVTTMIVTMALASHTVCTCSENGVLPAVLGRTTTNGVPVAATIIITVITAIFAAFPQLTDILINFGALCNVIVVAIVCITVMASRNHQPTLLTDTFRAPGGTALPIITLLVLVASYIPSILQGGWKLWAVTALYYVLGMLLYGKRRPLS